MKSLPSFLFAFLLDACVLVRALAWTLPALLCRAIFGNPYGFSRLRKPADPPRAPRHPYLLLLSFIEWDGAWQRPQHLLSRLSGEIGEMDAVCCAPIRAHNAPRRALRALWNSREAPVPGLVLLRPLVLPGENRCRAIRALNHLLLFDCLQREIRRRRVPPDVLMINSPFFARIFTWLPARVRVFDIMDEMVRFDWAPPNAERLEALAVTQADRVTAGTLSVARLKSEQYRGVLAQARYVPCGVDAGHFDCPDASLPPALAGLPRPIIGFFGAINERIDPDILNALAREMPEASIVLIGPVYRRFPLLDQHPNVHFPGLKPYADLPRYLAAFDCAIVPYRLTDGIEFVQPVKVLEYLAGGKPVVSTAIPDVVELHPGVVRIASGPGDFVRLVREAVAEGNARAPEYKAAAAGRGWSDMAREFAALFREALEEKRRAPRRVAHLIRGDHLGGAEELAINLCRTFDPPRFGGKVFCLAQGDTVQNRLAQRGVASEIVEMRSKTDLRVIFPLLERMRADKIALINTHTSRTNLLGRLIWRIAGIPVVSTAHTAVSRDLNDFGRSNRLNAWIERATWRWSAALPSGSRHNAAELIRLGAPADRVFYVPNGVETDVPVPPREETLRLARETFGFDPARARVVGMLASLRPRKGPEYLLSAMPILLKKFPNAHLLLVGSAEFVESRDYLGILKNLARDLEVLDRVTFAGHRDDTAAMLDLMEVCVLPSLFGEVLPLSILEAMVQGKPIVATRTEGNDELVRDGETGLLVPPHNPAALAEAIGALLADSARARAMGEAGRKRVEAEFSIAAMARAYEKIYETVLREIEG